MPPTPRLGDARANARKATDIAGREEETAVVRFRLLFLRFASSSSLEAHKGGEKRYLESPSFDLASVFRAAPSCRLDAIRRWMRGTIKKSKAKLIFERSKRELGSRKKEKETPAGRSLERETIKSRDTRARAAGAHVFLSFLRRVSLSCDSTSRTAGRRCSSRRKDRSTCR